jgi:hypothetical protein
LELSCHFIDSTTWFQRVDVSIRTTRSAADPLNLRPQAARLETRRNYLSNRVVEAWNMVPGDIKRCKTVSSLKMHTEATERLRWRTHRTAKRENQPAAGPHPEPDTTRHMRDPTWVIECKQKRNKKIRIGEPSPNYCAGPY